ncbi:MAG: aminoacyl-tRNA hydrolase [Deltaproteobacteria bacterium]|nr:aminoacyl-tRNA hydrolase [Deltaproteobacteria bacterium]
MRIIVGLGNPGKAYEESRHNLGFWVVDKMAELLGVSGWKNQHEALVARVEAQGAPGLLVKPQTYMNSSGRAVAALVRFYKIPLEDCLVVVDDLELPPGRIRQRPQGSDGGHNGLRSIIAETGGSRFKRIRIGIGRPEHKGQVTSHVLAAVGEDREALEQAVENAARSALEFLKDGSFESWSSP